MSVRRFTTRRTAQLAARAGVLGSSVMLAVTAAGLLPSSPIAGAAEAAGFATIATLGTTTPLAGGGSDTPFTLALPPGAACTGDSANANYNVTSFMVLGDVDIATVQFDPIVGPTPSAVGASFRQPLYEVGSGSSFAGQQTQNADPPGGPGVIIQPPAFDLFSAGFTPGQVPAGTYTLGIACIKGPPGPDQLDRFWTAKMAVQADTAQPGSQVKWTAIEQTGSPTTTAGSGGSTTTTGSGGTTTTTRAGASTTTTRPGSTTSTTAAGGSTTTTVGGATSTTRAAATGGGPSGSSGGGSLAATGSSPLGLAFWAAVLLICGRLALVLGRPPKVPDRA